MRFKFIPLNVEATPLAHGVTRLLFLIVFPCVLVFVFLALRSFAWRLGHRRRGVPVGS
jgi:hypothetical protein